MVFFTSDQHFFHDRIRHYSGRDFATVQEMNEQIILRYNSIVKPEDIVYHLGDFSFKEASIPYFLSRLNGIKHLISGNHCPTNSCHKKHKKAIQKYLEYGFASVQDKGEITLGKYTFELNHFPFLVEEDTDQRYKQFRPINKGQWLLHGHIHEKWKIRGRGINVGVDVNDFYPVSETQILEMVADILESEQE